VQTLAGEKKAGDSDDPPRFYQPGGLSLAGSTLYVADTNNFAIRTIDVKSGAVGTLELSGLKPPARPAPSFARALVTAAPRARIEPGKSITLDVKLPLGSKTQVNADSGSMPYLVEATGTKGLVPSDFAGKVHEL